MGLKTYSFKGIVSKSGSVAVEQVLEFEESFVNEDFAFFIPAVLGDQVYTIENVAIEGADAELQQSDEGVTVAMQAPVEAFMIRYDRVPASNEDASQDILVLRLLPDIDIPIQSASFSVLMPSRFEQQALTVYSPQGGSNHNSLEYAVFSGVVSGSILQPLSPNSPVEAAFTLADGFFIPNVTVSETQSPTKSMDMQGIGRLLSIGLGMQGGLSAILFAFSRRRGDSIDSNTLADPAQAGYILRGYSKNGDLVALLPYWASQGIIRMELLQDGRIRFTQTGQLPQSCPIAQHRLFCLLFQNGTVLTLGALPAGFSKGLNDVRVELERAYEQDSPVFTKASRRAKAAIAVCLLFSIISLLFCVLPIGALFDRTVAAFAFALVILEATLWVLNRVYAFRLLSFIYRVLIVIALLLLVAVLYALTSLSSGISPQLNDLAVLSFLASILQAAMYLFSRRRTAAGLRQKQTLGQILRDINTPPPSVQMSDAAFLYAYSISLGVSLCRELSVWPPAITKTLRNMQVIWNRLERWHISGRWFYQP